MSSWRTNRKTGKKFPTVSVNVGKIGVGDFVLDVRSGEYGTVVAKQWIFGWQYLVEFTDGRRVWKNGAFLQFVE